MFSWLSRCLRWLGGSAPGKENAAARGTESPCGPVLASTAAAASAPGPQPVTSIGVAGFPGPSPPLGPPAAPARAASDASSCEEDPVPPSTMKRLKHSASVELVEMATPGPRHSAAPTDQQQQQPQPAVPESTMTPLPHPPHQHTSSTAGPRHEQPRTVERQPFKSIQPINLLTPVAASRPEKATAGPTPSADAASTPASDGDYLTPEPPSNEPYRRYMLDSGKVVGLNNTMTRYHEAKPLRPVIDNTTPFQERVIREMEIEEMLQVQPPPPPPLQEFSFPTLTGL